MSTIAIIPARSGSKRIPGKNIRPFIGKPIIAYSIKAALQSGCFDEVMVSTDSEEIAVIAEEFGARVPFFRSQETSGDYATTTDVLWEVILHYRSMGISLDSFGCIYPTAPFINGNILSKAMKQLEDANAVVSVVKYSFPPQRAFMIREGNVVYMYPQFEKKRSQDLEPIYHDCGQFYLCRTEAFIKYQTIIPPGTKPFILLEEEVQDIDTLSDWKIAEMKYQLLYDKE